MSKRGNRRSLRDVDPQLADPLTQIKGAIRKVVGDGFQLFLFGSRARGDHEQDSDVDLMVVLPEDLFSVQLCRDVRYAVYQFSHGTEYVFNVMVSSEGRFRECSGFKVYGAVEREGVAV